MARRLRRARRPLHPPVLPPRDWDHHGGIRPQIAGSAGEVDSTRRRAPPLRGLLEDTLVLFGGEFGRTPMAQGDGRDHHIKGFSMWLAGGGIKPEVTYGAIDEFGYNAAGEHRPRPTTSTPPCSTSSASTTCG
ncbi:MAG: DUF1501 domain-containing protein [Gemmataceae bacterium]